MRTSLKIILDGQWNTQNELCLWGLHPTGEVLSATDLGLHLLSSDPATWYGAHTEIWEEGPGKGIRLSAESALAFLCTPTANPLISLEFSSFLRNLRNTAIELNEVIRAALLVPVMTRDGLGWKLSETCDKEQFPLLSGTLQSHPSIAAWAAALMPMVIADSPEKLDAIDKLEQWTERFADSAMPEQQLLEIIGWSRPNHPYMTGFRLDDPNPSEPNGLWALTFLLTDRERTTVIDCDVLGTPVSSTPNEWAYEPGEAEAALATWLKAIPFLNHPVHAGTLRVALSDEQAWIFLTEISKQISDFGGIVLLPAWWNRLRGKGAKLKAKFQQGPVSHEPAMFGMEQMLDFDWKVSIGDIELSEQEFWSIAEEQKPLHFIRGEWIALDSALVDQIRKVMGKTKRNKGVPLREVLLRQFGKLETDGLVDQLEEHPLDWETETSGALMQFIEQLGRAEQMPAVPISPLFQGTLRGYQAEGLSWLAFLRKFGLGGCLADDMGLGKTIQYIAYLLHIKEEPQPLRPSLLICPTSLVGNWHKELERFAPTLRIYQHYGTSRTREPEVFAKEASEYDLVITTYMTALIDNKALQSVHWNSLCLDEAQNMKNAYTKQSTAIRRLSADHRIALTGTPVENRLSELWSILDFINPGYLGSQAGFERQFGRLIERERGKASEQLRRLVRPFILRRMKSDARIAPDLPDKVESKVFIPLTTEQAALYENVLSGLFGGIQNRNGIDRRGAILAALTQLKQICDHPALFTKDNSIAATSPRHSHKSERLLEMISELRAEGDRCLVFTQYVEMGNLLQRMIERTLKEPVLYLNGSTPKTQRDKMVELFQGFHSDQEALTEELRPGIFVLSLKAGGTGLNLTAANHVFHYDRWWNPAVENQATDRAYRIGQKQHVQVHKFITLGTVEERINEMIEKKQSLSREIIDTSDSDNWVTELSTDELHDLFSLRQSWIEG
jgi:superfamily II DNA or RNA helicase